MLLILEIGVFVDKKFVSRKLMLSVSFLRVIAAENGCSAWWRVNTV